MTITHNTISLFSIDIIKIKEAGTLLFSIILRKNDTHEFHIVLKPALDYNLLYRSIHFWCHDTTLKIISSIEKVNLTWNKQTNFKKLDLLSRDFQIASRDRGYGKFAWVIFLLGCGNRRRSDFEQSIYFSKLKTAFCK